MGEEKPDEELMGKRKSSPRLSPTPLSAGTIIVTFEVENIRWRGNKLIRFCKPLVCGNITPVNLSGNNNHH